MITLTTDFGYSDSFSGQMKGVMLSIYPESRIIDITHGIRAHDVRAAALSIAASHRYFPKGTVHVVVVDPGVGSSRAPMILEACGNYFVGPDNGIFTLIKKDCPRARAWRINPEGVELESPGKTFHGRDLFAPVAARLDMGDFPSEHCEPMEGIVTLAFPESRRAGDILKGEVVHLDAFGNAITNINASDIEALRTEAGEPLAAEAGDSRCPLVGYYAEAVSGPHALVNSDGLLEIFIFEKSAASALGLEPGSEIRVIRQ